jgi:biopolymer transport protein TolQ
MRSFEGIAAANNTSLAVVAPGIPEALFATAMGLAAAIPAVVAYNMITVDLGRFVRRMQGRIGRSAVCWPAALASSRSRGARLQRQINHSVIGLELPLQLNQPTDPR